MDGTVERDDLLHAVTSLFARGVMSPSGHGDVSTRVDGGQMLLAVPGDIGDLRATDLVRLRLAGDVQRDSVAAVGELKAEIASLHAGIYARRADIGAIMHTHSPSLLGFAMANRELPCRYEAMRFGQPTPVPVVPWARRGTPDWQAGIWAVLDQHPQTRGLLLGNHGVLVFGADAAAAAIMTTVLEEAAAGELAAGLLGGALPLPLT